MRYGPGVGRGHEVLVMFVIHSTLPFSVNQFGSWAGFPHRCPKGTSRLTHHVIQKETKLPLFQQKSQKSIRRASLCHRPHSEQFLCLEDALCLFWGRSVRLGQGWCQLPQDHRDPQQTRECLWRENAFWEGCSQMVKISRDGLWWWQWWKGSWE